LGTSNDPFPFDITSLPPIQFWLYVGINDLSGLAPYNRDFAEALREYGLPIKYIEDDGDHIDKIAQRLAEFIEYASGFFE
jgi:hypothetical protein